MVALLLANPSGKGKSYAIVNPSGGIQYHAYSWMFVVDDCFTCRASIEDKPIVPASGGPLARPRRQLLRIAEIQSRRPRKGDGYRIMKQLLDATDENDLGFYLEGSYTAASVGLCRKLKLKFDTWSRYYYVD